MSLSVKLWHTDFRIQQLWLRFQLGESQYLQFRSFGLTFGLVPYLPERVILCIGSSLIFFFGLILDHLVWCSSFPFCRMYFLVFVRPLSEHLVFFSFSSLSRSFLSVIHVINFNISNTVLCSGRSHSFYSSINFPSDLPVFPCLFVLRERNFLESCICFFPVNIICCIIWSICLF